MDQTLHQSYNPFGRRRQTYDQDDDETKSNAFLDSVQHKLQKELRRRILAVANKKLADTEKPTAKTKKALKTAERALQAQRDKMKTLSKNPMETGDVAQVGDATKENVEFMDGADSKRP